MAEVTHGGNPVSTNRELPSVGSAAPAYTHTNGDLSPITHADLARQNVQINIYTNIDTPTSPTSDRTNNERAADLDNTTVVCVSADLPFAQSRFCGSEGLENVVTASTFKNPEFLTDFGVLFTDGRLEGLAARAVVVIGGDGTVAHTELVGEVGSEPDYDAALGAVG